MIRNNETFFVPWESIHESNPQEILDVKENVTLKPFLIMQGALDAIDLFKAEYALILDFDGQLIDRLKRSA